MELDCVISNQMKDYRLVHSVKFQDHITNRREMASVCIWTHLQGNMCGLGYFTLFKAQKQAENWAF